MSDGISDGMGGFGLQDDAELRHTLQSFCKHDEASGVEMPAASVQVQCELKVSPGYKTFWVRNLWEGILFLLSDQAERLTITETGPGHNDWSIEIKREAEGGLDIRLTAANRFKPDPSKEEDIKYVLERLFSGGGPRQGQKELTFSPTILAPPVV